MRFKNFVKLSLIVLTVVSALSCSTTKGLSEKIGVHAHRCGAGLMPENTIAAAKNAMDLGADTLEFDLQVSKDMQVVVSHEAYFHYRYSTRPDGSEVHRSDEKEYLYKLPYETISQYDVGLKPVKSKPEQENLAASKPLASDLIDFAEDYSHKAVNYNIEIKSLDRKDEGELWPDYKTFCDLCMSLLISKNLGKRLIIQSFDERALNYIHEKWPEVTISYLTGVIDMVNLNRLFSGLTFTPEWWSPELHTVTKRNVRWCHEHGVKVVPWTADSEKEIRRLQECGVDAIISNYPDRLVQVVGKNILTW